MSFTKSLQAPHVQTVSNLILPIDCQFYLDPQYQTVQVHADVQTKAGEQKAI